MALPTSPPGPGESTGGGACPNCGTISAARARYCMGCGQRVGASILRVRALVADLLEDELALDGRLPRTLYALLLRPGHLTREYAAGRVRRYVRPFKLYLACSILFFLALSISIRIDLPSAEGGGLRGEGTAPAMHVEHSDRLEAGVSIQKTSVFQRFVQQFADKVSEDPRYVAERLVDRMLSDAPKAVFILLPIFALFLKLLYIRGRRLYAEHLIFILHYHSFGFLFATPLLLIPSGSIKSLLWLILPLYLIWAMRRVYGQSWTRTIIKSGIFGWLYFFSIIITLAVVSVLAAVIVGGALNL